MSLDNNVGKFFNDVKYQVKLTGEYITKFGKAFSLEFLRNEYEGMNVKFDTFPGQRGDEAENITSV